MADLMVVFIEHPATELAVLARQVAHLLETQDCKRFVVSYRLTMLDQWVKAEDVRPKLQEAPNG